MPKCQNKGCGKEYTDENEECIYHPGPPIFHEGQKGWQCCKPRVLTFDEFLSIPPCTTGKHNPNAVQQVPVNTSGSTPTTPITASVSKDGTEVYNRPGASSKPAAPTAQAAAPAPPKEAVVRHDDLKEPVAEGTKCRRNGCGAVYTGYERSADKADETSCVFHKGAPIFHEGSKGYLCCKRRVLEFEEFLKLEGCCTEDRHNFQAPREDEKDRDADGLEKVSCRSDFYQTYDSVIVSIFAKKTDAAASTITILPDALDLDLVMTATKTRFREKVELYAGVDPEGSKFKVMGTKVEFTLKKADETSWPVLRKGEETGEIIQVGKPKA